MWTPALGRFCKKKNLKMRFAKMLIAKYGKGKEKLIQKFEDKYGVKFDSEYRNFLIKYNGGETPETTFKKGKRQEDVRYLFGLNTEESIEKQLEYFDHKEKGCIPIGEDVFGNYFTIGITDENSGLIYFCDHERGYRKTEIAKSFNDFISKCKSKEINERAKRTVEEREQEMIKNGFADLINEHLKSTWQQEYEKYKDMVQEEVIL